MSNPFLPEKTRTLTLTETGVTVSVRSVTLDEGLAFTTIKNLPEDKRAGKIKEFLASIITWDAKHVETGEPIAVTAENIGLLPLADGNRLVKEVMAFISPPEEDQKKEQEPSL